MDAVAAGPVPLVLDLHIAHERVGSSSDPIINGHLRYPNDLDGPLNEAAADKIRQYHADYSSSVFYRHSKNRFVSLHSALFASRRDGLRSEVAHSVIYRLSWVDKAVTYDQPYL